MKVKVIPLALVFILSFGAVFAQQFNLFEVFPLDGIKIKYDRYGNPCVVGLSSQGYFYLFKSENGQFKSPVLIGKSPSVYTSPYTSWDFDVDTNGVVHIAGVIYDHGSAYYINPTPFYLNSSMDSALVFNSVSLGTLNPASPAFDYIRVLRTKDDKIVVNIAVLFPNYGPYGPRPDSLIWIHLANPSANNLNITVDTISFSSYFRFGQNPHHSYTYNFSANKYLYLTLYEVYSKDGVVLSDTLSNYRAYTLYKIAPGGNSQVIYASDPVELRSYNFVNLNHTFFPFYQADLNDGYKNWYRVETTWGGYSWPNYVSSYIDKDDNLHLIKIESRQVIYLAYTPSNLPINAEGVTPTYNYTISYDSTRHWQFRSELIDWNHVPLPLVYVSAYNLNKAIAHFANWGRHLFLNENLFSGIPGIVLMHQESGNYRYELLAGSSIDDVERKRFGYGTNWYIDQTGQVYLWNSWENIVYDSVRTAYIYLYKLRSIGNDYIMNYSLTEDIKEVTISPVPVGEKLHWVFKSFHYTFGKDNKMYFLVFGVDSIRPAGYNLGRIFLLKETSSGQWDTVLVTPDTTNQALFDSYTSFIVDENNVVHVVYSTFKDKPRVFYTNNEGGSFKPPIVIDTTINLKNVRIEVSRDGLCYIWGDAYGLAGSLGYSVYYYGDYGSGFKRSSRQLSDFGVAGVDANGNLYIVSDPWWSSSGYEVYLYKFYRDSALIYRFPRKVLFNFQPIPPITYPSFSFIRDEDGQIHLLGTWAGKFYHWKASDNFTGMIEYDYSGLLKYDDLLYSITSISAIANTSDKRIYFLIGRGTFGPLIVGWIPYVVTQVEDNRDVLPGEFTLSQNYPNPFNPVTTINFDLPVKSSVEISIYDVLGRKLKTVVNEVRDAGRYKVLIDMNEYASGVYFYRMVAKPVMGGSDFVSVKKMLLVK